VKYERGGNGGTLSTAANLVFQGSVDGYLNAYDAENGERLWSYDTQNAVMGGPSTFELDGEQYVATLAGIGGVAMGGGLGGGGSKRSEFGRVVVFKLGGTARLPQIGQQIVRKAPDLTNANATGDAALGEKHYDQICSVCHGARARSTTSVPDLRYSAVIADRNEFKAIVLDGTRAAKGMVGFSAMLKPADPEAIRAYLVKQSKDL
jgi:mono/diheme cytochrome c family protein